VVHINIWPLLLLILGGTSQSIKLNISRGTNPKTAATADPEAAIIEECVANCDAPLSMYS
jgi:hypothetical protein